MRTLCHEGLRRYNAEAGAALADSDGWRGLVGFLERVVDADVHSLAVHLAGTFTPDESILPDVVHSGEITEELVRRAHASGRLRADVNADDLGLVLESCAAIAMPDAQRPRTAANTMVEDPTQARCRSQGIRPGNHENRARTPPRQSRRATRNPRHHNRTQNQLTSHRTRNPGPADSHAGTGVPELLTEASGAPVAGGGPGCAGPCEGFDGAAVDPCGPAVVADDMRPVQNGRDGCHRTVLMLAVYTEEIGAHIIETASTQAEFAATQLPGSS
ncbi:hypothetical protein [Nocardia sp. NPDC004604]|uniref:hypothetical protein n=1 Tax=Nocardia sp. NPDC004604 TaxID=3157013 RepID=UPI0033A316EA